MLRISGAHPAQLGIDRQAEHMALREAERLEIGPPVLYFEPDVLITRALPGTPLSQRNLTTSDHQAVARVLSRFHRGDLTLGERITPLDQSRAYLTTASKLKPALSLSRHFAALEKGERELGDLLRRPFSEKPDRVCHNDMLPRNIFRLPDGSLRLIDFEYVSPGCVFRDLGQWVRVVGSHPLEIRSILEAYFGGYEREHELRARAFAATSALKAMGWRVMQSIRNPKDAEFHLKEADSRISLFEKLLSEFKQFEQQH